MEYTTSEILCSITFNYAKDSKFSVKFAVYLLSFLKSKGVYLEHYYQIEPCVLIAYYSYLIETNTHLFDDSPSDDPGSPYKCTVPRVVKLFSNHPDLIDEICSSEHTLEHFGIYQEDEKLKVILNQLAESHKKGMSLYSRLVEYHNKFSELKDLYTKKRAAD